MNWKDPAIATRLAQLWREGHSCSTIARMMGAVSRNAVIGAVRRQDLPFRGYRPGGTVAKQSIASPRKSKPHSEGGGMARKKSVKPFRFQTSPNMVRQVAFTPEPLPMPAADDLARVSARAVEDSHCRWPVGDPTDLATRMDDPFHCGLPKMPGSSYCAGHHARATVPLTPRQQRHSNVVPMPKRELQVA